MVIWIIHNFHRDIPVVLYSDTPKGKMGTRLLNVYSAAMTITD
jgi:hypothetical protein